MRSPANPFWPPTAISRRLVPTSCDDWTVLLRLRIAYEEALLLSENAVGRESFPRRPIGTHRDLRSLGVFAGA